MPGLYFEAPHSHPYLESLPETEMELVEWHRARSGPQWMQSDARNAWAADRANTRVSV